MTFAVKWTTRAARFVSRLPQQIGLRIQNKIESIKHNPYRNVEHYEGSGSFKPRIGDYRALLDIDSPNKLIRVEIVDKRSRIYRRR